MEINDFSKYGISEELIREYINKINNGDKIIAVTGEFSSGKSTFINALINKNNFLPSSNLECTPVFIDLIKSNTKYIEVKYNDGKVKHIDATNENVEKYAKNVEDYDKSILSITIPVESEYLLDNYHLIDTPGTNTTYEEHELITKEVIRKSDLVLYVFNKALTDYDIQKIQEIQKYTSDIFFILTHIDDEIDGKYINKETDYINKFVLEAEADLENKLNIKASAQPIGSKAAYEDSALIDAIRENINFAVKCNNEKKIKENAKRQLGVIFEKRLEELLEELDLIRSLSEVDGEKLSAKIEKLNNKINTMNMDEEDITKNFNKIVEENKVKIENNIKNIYQEEEAEIVEVLVSSEEIDEELLSLTFNKASEKINNKVKAYLDKTINELINYIYLENNVQLEGINTELDLKLEAKLHLPTIEELDLTCDDDLRQLREDRLRAGIEIEAIKDEVAATSDKIAMIKDNISKNDEEYNQIKEQILTKGGYIPEYDEIAEDGGEETGRIIGRTIGEIADIALIFFTPAAAAPAALKAADMAKDSVKLAQYATKSIKVAQEGMKKAGKVIESAKGKKGGKLLEILDSISIGGIGEKVGGALGKSIKPSKVAYVENETKKQIWIDEMERLEESKREVKGRQARLEVEIENGNISITEAARRKREIEKEIAISEEREKLLLVRKEKEYYENKSKALEEHYKNEAGRIFTEEAENTIIKVKDIFKFTTQQILIKSGNEFNKRLQVMKESIDQSTGERQEITNKLEAKTALVEELKNYKQWIDELIV
ncbi:hypothetical protein C1H57_09125 [Clostridium sp. 2-1]|uniref:dynamin family protein n=1 Tax=Clostridium TaxID=1485 RepID=UPI000CDB09D7|nr:MULTISPECIES: dynamin family protein [Clostridium]MBN7575332.1 dynamin family protein [Clostridium beijerinckii]MBN7580631.1 dynamin family protein [Clostridium beijerinckii]MBN7585096.1 dynamin family protein [Clostridium beijerinckii]MBO0520975.1 dynamin family protein [Clostridium beijerinckii]POO91666.1 hypothetical protein C1H57_09125 [Clostridium sp. 2-1]